MYITKKQQKTAKTQSRTVSSAPPGELGLRFLKFTSKDPSPLEILLDEMLLVYKEKSEQIRTSAVEITDDEKILPDDIVIVDYMFINNSKKGWIYQTDTDKINSNKKISCVHCGAKIGVSKCCQSDCRVRSYCSEDCYRRD